MYNTINKEAKKKGISIRQLEKSAGIGNGTIGGWNESSPKLDTLKKVADVLGMTASELIHNAEQEEEKQCQN